jgi:hypothetical protein
MEYTLCKLRQSTKLHLEMYSCANMGSSLRPTHRHTFNVSVSKLWLRRFAGLVPNVHQAPIFGLFKKLCRLDGKNAGKFSFLSFSFAVWCTAVLQALNYFLNFTGYYPFKSNVHTKHTKQIHIRTTFCTRSRILSTTISGLFQMDVLKTKKNRKWGKNSGKKYFFVNRIFYRIF